MKINRVIRILIFSDFWILASLGFINPILAIFITGSVEGGNVAIAGLAIAVYRITEAIFQIPVGWFLDKTKGEKDDFYALILGSTIIIIILFLYPAIHLLWQLFLLQFFLGFGRALSLPPWYSIFTKHIDQLKVAFEWSLENTVVGIAIAASAALGGFVANYLGFNTLFVLAGITFILGTVPLLLIYQNLREAK